MIHPVLGGRVSIGGVLGSGRGGAAAAQWWLAGGVSAANAVAVYQPIGAASLAASYTNLANPGTYDAAPGVAPTWAAAGWTFNGLTQYLTTGVVPASGWSMIARFSNASTSRFNAICGSQKTPGNYRFYLANSTTPTNRVYGAGGALLVGTSTASGVMVIAGQSAYLNGNSDGTVATAWDGATDIAIALGRNGTLDNFFSGKIQAVAIYNTTLSAGQVAAISAAMAALTG